MWWLRKLRILLFFAGLLMLAVCVAALIHRTVLSTAELAHFQVRQVDVTPDFSLWSDKRIVAYQESLMARVSPPIAVLRIRKLHVEVPVLEGTDELILNRGVGRIAGTALPGQDGNIGIAGHRDGFFRGLKDVAAGDTIELITNGNTTTYVVDRILIVEPRDISVLGPRPRSLTLVTCYPFYFIGSAPQRYIVEATIRDSGRQTSSMLAQVDRR